MMSRATFINDLSFVHDYVGTDAICFARVVGRSLPSRIGLLEDMEFMWKIPIYGKF